LTCTVLDAHVVYAGHGPTFLTFDEEHGHAEATQHFRRG
jgi:hypothetical protein